MTRTETLSGTGRSGKFPQLPKDIGTDYNFKRKIVWKNVAGFIVLHAAAFYGLYLLFFVRPLTVFYGKREVEGWGG